MSRWTRVTKCIFIIGAISAVLLLPACGGGGEIAPEPDSTTETISYPDTPTGPRVGNANEALTYTTGGSTSSLGHSIQYRFNWGDGSYSDWLSSPAASHSWVLPGDYMVTAEARSAVNHEILSDLSDNKRVTIEQPSISLNVRIDYIGVKNAHGGNVQLVVVVSDEDKIEKHLIPPVEEGLPMGNFEVKRIKQRVFHTPSVKNDVKINILAYHRDQSKTDYLAMIKMMEWYYGDSINMLKQLVENMPENDELIGYYEETWGLDESWGVGPHSNVGHGDDFRVWLSIWSDEEPPLVSEPYFSPDVKIKNVSMPPEVKQSNSGWFYYRWYTNTLTLVNNESCPVEVYWSAVSSAQEEFHGTVTIPAKGTKDISEDYYYENDIGPLAWTYTISHNDRELHSWHGSMDVIPGPYS